MVMLANNKTVHQINNDLQLFLGENTDRFTEWLQQAMANPSVLVETTSKPKEREETDSERMCLEVVSILYSKRGNGTEPLPL